MGFNELHNNGCECIFFDIHIEGAPFSVIFSMLQINYKMAVWFNCGVASLVAHVFTTIAVYGYFKLT
jgi:hypothetical protein